MAAEHKPPYSRLYPILLHPETYERECINCGKKQKWVIGKGDGELGRWQSV